MFTMSRKVAQNSQNRVILTLTLNRKHPNEDWGFTITGGWEQGQWIGKFFVLLQDVQYVEEGTPKFTK